MFARCFLSKMLKNRYPYGKSILLIYKSKE
nr:MAG TPA_asm: hypothetical protein [Caudoviricetes sp.]DAV64570.1 MAG TPA: hypothetical protein [Caudoviricetes sp.]